MKGFGGSRGRGRQGGSYGGVVVGSYCEEVSEKSRVRRTGAVMYERRSEHRYGKKGEMKEETAQAEPSLEGKLLVRVVDAGSSNRAKHSRGFKNGISSIENRTGGKSSGSSVW